MFVRPIARLGHGDHFRQWNFPSDRATDNVGFGRLLWATRNANPIGLHLVVVSTVGQHQTMDVIFNCRGLL